MKKIKPLPPLLPQPLKRTPTRVERPRSGAANVPWSIAFLRCPETAMLVGVAPNALPGVPESHPPVGNPRESAEGFRA